MHRLNFCALCCQVAELWDASIENTVRKLAYGTILGALGGLFLFRAPPPQHCRSSTTHGTYPRSKPPPLRGLAARARAVPSRASSGAALARVVYAPAGTPHTPLAPPLLRG